MFIRLIFIFHLITFHLGCIHCVKPSQPAVAAIKQAPPKYICTAEGWINNGDTCYHVLDRQEKWHKVQFMCDLLKAKFAYVDDESDMDALAKAAALRSAPTVWLLGTNSDHQKPGKFIWRDGAKSEVDGAVTPWAPGFPKQNVPSDQFIYMKVDLETSKSSGLAHSMDGIERYVACMLPARDTVQAANRRRLKIQEDPLIHPTSAGSMRLQKRSDTKRRRAFRRRSHEFDRDAGHHRRRHPARFQFRRDEDEDDDKDEDDDDVDKVTRGAGKIKDGFAESGDGVGKKIDRSVKDARHETGKAISGSGPAFPVEWSNLLTLCLFPVAIDWRLRQ